MGLTVMIDGNISIYFDIWWANMVSASIKQANKIKSSPSASR